VSRRRGSSDVEAAARQLGWGVAVLEDAGWGATRVSQRLRVGEDARRADGKLTGRQIHGRG
jgi:hypothetical protein